MEINPYLMNHIHLYFMYILLLWKLVYSKTIDLVTVSGGPRFDGIGAISAGATTRLLVDYPEVQRNEILDYLFLPKFGASLQILKVEIGGDAQSTDGTESSHMHDENTVDYESGYEWWLMREAKLRNPRIQLCGLSWAFPGWIRGGPTAPYKDSPFNFPNKTVSYAIEWLKGATYHGLNIDCIGIWNERPSDIIYVRLLRAALNKNGFGSVKIVAKDGVTLKICNELAENKEYSDVVDIVGLHYPSDYNPQRDVCSTLKKPVWSSEESSSYNDMNGAACWARVINSHFVLSGITASLIWNIVGSYYHGVNYYSTSLLTAVQPWSGYYENFAVLWATAHMTQFTEIGWEYAPVGNGSGILERGGFYTTIIDPEGDDFTLQLIKISHDHASCVRPALPIPQPPIEPEEVNITFDKLFVGWKDTINLHIWKSNFENENPYLFKQMPDIKVTRESPILKVRVGIGDYITVSTVNGMKGSHGTKIPDSKPSFPLPWEDDFQNYKTSKEPKYLSDQIGVFEIHEDMEGKFLRQMVPQLQIRWTKASSRGPMTVIGMREWQDISISVDFRLPHTEAAACVGLRVDQFWNHGVVTCIWMNGTWQMTYGGPVLHGITTVLLKGEIQPANTELWHHLSMTTKENRAYASLDGVPMYNSTIENNDVGFAALGTNGWYSVDFKNLKLEKVGKRWQIDGSMNCMTPLPGTHLVTTPCQSNGLISRDQDFELLSNWQIRHIPSELCVTGETSRVLLKQCKFGDQSQMFHNHYTNVRNELTLLVWGGNESLVLAGDLSGKVIMQKPNSPLGWTKWVYFPNTRSLRNQYIADNSLGYPRCLSTCSERKRIEPTVHDPLIDRLVNYKVYA